MLINAQCDFLGLEQASYPVFTVTDEVTAQFAIPNLFASNLHATANRIHRANTPLLLFHCTPHTIIFCHSSGSLWNSKRNKSETVLTFLAGDFRFRAH